MTAALLPAPHDDSPPRPARAVRVAEVGRTAAAPAVAGRAEADAEQLAPVRTARRPYLVPVPDCEPPFDDEVARCPHHGRTDCGAAEPPAPRFEVRHGTWHAPGRFPVDAPPTTRFTPTRSGQSLAGRVGAGPVATASGATAVARALRAAPTHTARGGTALVETEPGGAASAGTAMVDIPSVDIPSVDTALVDTAPGGIASMGTAPVATSLVQTAPGGTASTGTARVDTASGVMSAGVSRRAAPARPAVGSADHSARLLARALTEVLAGHRPLTQLRAFCTPAIFAALDRRQRHPSPALPHVLSVRVCEPADGVAEVAAVYRRGDRVRMVAFRLERLTDPTAPAGGRWTITAVQPG